MSMQVNVKQNGEQLTSFSATQKAKDVSSYAVFGMMDQIDDLLQLGKMTSYTESFTEDPTSENQEPVTSQAAETQSSEQPAVDEQTVEFTQQSIFNAAGDMCQMQTDANDSLEQELENQIAIMQAQVEAMEAAAEWWAEFGPAWEEYEDDPSNYDAFMQVMDLLEQEYSDDPETEAQLQEIQDQGTDEYNKEQTWKSQSGWHHFWHGQLDDPDYFENYSESVQGTLQDYAEEAVGSPVLFQEALANGETAFQTQINQMLLCIQVLMNIVDILEGTSTNAQTAMFDMEALLMDLEQLQINTNTQQSQQQQEVSQKIADNLQYNLEQIQEQLKQSQHSGGLFGCVKDFFKSVTKLFEDIGETVYYAATGNEEKAKNTFDDLTQGFQIFGEAFKDIFTGDFKEGFEELFTATLLTMLFGPAGIALLGTQFGQDIQNFASLAIDAEQAFFQLLGAGVLAAVGDKSDASKLMESDKKLGEDMLANPALKTITDLAMVAIIAAMALTGNELVAGIMLALFVASESGLMEKGTEKLADAIGGPDSAVAKIIADVIVITAVTILTAGAGAAEAAFSTAADSAVAAGEEVASELTNVAAEEADEAIAQTSKEATEQTSSRGTRIAKRAASVGAFGFGTTLGSSSLALDILEATKKKDSEALAIILELVQVIVAAVTASIGGFSVMTESVGNTARSAEEGASNLTQFASRLAVGANGIAAVSGAAQGGETIIMGKNEKVLAKYRANVALDEATQTNTTAMINQTSEELKQIVKGYEEIIATAFQTPGEVANAELQALIQA